MTLYSKETQLRITYDHIADAVMIYLVPIGPGEAVGADFCFPEQMKRKSNLNLDFNADDQLIGIEILYASRVLPPQVLREAEQIGNRSRQETLPEE